MPKEISIPASNHNCQQEHPHLSYSAGTQGHSINLIANYHAKQNDLNAVGDEMGINNTNPLAGGYKKYKYTVLCGKNIKTITASTELNAAKIAFNKCNKCHLINVIKNKKNNLFKGTVYLNGIRKVQSLY